MTDTYSRSWELMWELCARPTPEHPKACVVSRDGDLGPCGDCMHCHDDAQDLEDLMNRIAKE